MDLRVVLCVLAFLLALQRSGATVLVVGDDYGWTHTGSFNSSGYPNYTEWSAKQMVLPGDQLIFSYLPALDDVYLLPTKKDFDACDFRDASLLNGGSSGVYAWIAPPGPSVYYFACSTYHGAHCKAGQKLMISIFASSSLQPESSPSPSLASSYGSVSRPALPPRSAFSFRAHVDHRNVHSPSPSSQYSSVSVPARSRHAAKFVPTAAQHSNHPEPVAPSSGYGYVIAPSCSSGLSPRSSFSFRARTAAHRNPSAPASAPVPTTGMPRFNHPEPSRAPSFDNGPLSPRFEHGFVPAPSLAPNYGSGVRSAFPFRAHTVHPKVPPAPSSEYGFVPAPSPAPSYGSGFRSAFPFRAHTVHPKVPPAPTSEYGFVPAPSVAPSHGSRADTIHRKVSPAPSSEDKSSTPAFVPTSVEPSLAPNPEYASPAPSPLTFMPTSAFPIHFPPEVSPGSNSHHGSFVSVPVSNPSSSSPPPIMQDFLPTPPLPDSLVAPPNAYTQIPLPEPSGYYDDYSLSAQTRCVWSKVGMLMILLPLLG